MEKGSVQNSCSIWYMEDKIRDVKIGGMMESVVVGWIGKYDAKLHTDTSP